MSTPRIIHIDTSKPAQSALVIGVTNNTSTRLFGSVTIADQLPMVLRFVEANDYSDLNGDANLTWKVVLGQLGGTEYAQSTNWLPSASYGLTGSLSLNTTTLSASLEGEDSISAIFEVEGFNALSGLRKKYLQVPVTIWNQVTTSSFGPPTASIFITQAEGDARYLLKGVDFSSSFVLGGNSDGATAVLGTKDNQSLNIITNDLTRIYVQSDGNVGIGATTTDKFHVSGNAYVTTGVTSSQFLATTQYTGAKINVTQVTGSGILGTNITSTNVTSTNATFTDTTSTAANVTRLTGSSLLSDGVTVNGNVSATNLSGSGKLLVTGAGTSGFNGSYIQRKLVIGSSTVEAVGDIHVENTSADNKIVLRNPTENFNVQMRCQNPSGTANFGLAGGGHFAVSTDGSGIHTSGVALLIRSGSGNVGIGLSTNTTNKLQVNGNVVATSFTGSLLGNATTATTASNATTATTANSYNTGNALTAASLSSSVINFSRVGIGSDSGNFGFSSTSLLSYNGTMKWRVVQAGFTATADLSKASTDTNSIDLLGGTADGTRTFAAGVLNESGKHVKLNIRGYTTLASNNSASLAITLGGTSLVTATALPLHQPSGEFEIDFDFTVRSTGASGTVIGQGTYKHQSTGGSTVLPLRMSTTATRNLTSALAYAATMNWTVSDGGLSTFVMTNANIEVS
jgi:hypothetical protein